MAALQGSCTVQQLAVSKIDPVHHSQLCWTRLLTDLQLLRNDTSCGASGGAALHIFPVTTKLLQ